MIILKKWEKSSAIRNEWLQKGRGLAEPDDIMYKNRQA